MDRVVHGVGLEVGPVDVCDLYDQNVYKNVLAISKRSEQIESESYEKLQNQIAEWIGEDTSSEQNNDSVIVQMELSKYFESLPKPNVVAEREFLNGELSIDDALE